MTETDVEAHLRETARHLVWMASLPMALEHAKFREKELIASSPLYARLPDFVRQARIEWLKKGAKREPSTSA